MCVLFNINADKLLDEIIGDKLFFFDLARVRQSVSENMTRKSATVLQMCRAATC